MYIVSVSLRINENVSRANLLNVWQVAKSDSLTVSYVII